MYMWNNYNNLANDIISIWKNFVSMMMFWEIVFTFKNQNIINTT